MAINADLSVVLGITSSTTTNTIGTVVETINIEPATTSLTSSQATVAWSRSATLNATSEEIDLTALTAPTGTVAFTAVRVLYVEVTTATDGVTLAVSGGASNPWTGVLSDGATTEQVAAAGYVLRVNPSTTGYAVSGTSKTVKFDAGVNTLSYKIALVGTGTIS